MTRTPALPTAPLTATGLLALVAVVGAMTASVGALAYTRHSTRLVNDVEVQTTITEAFQRRSLDCLDLAQSWLADPQPEPGQHERAQMSLEISRGLTLCLVQSRDDARLDIATLSACVREVEIANTIFDILPHDTIARPAC